MPKVILNKEAPPPIDWLWAASLERRIQLGMSIKELSKRVGVSYGTMRNYAMHSPWAWPKRIRDKACKELGISVTETPTDNGVEVRVG